MGSCKRIKCACNYCLRIHIVGRMTLATTLPRADSRWSPRLWGILVVLCGALFLDALDVSMVGVALPSIRADLGLSTASLQWVVSGYVLGYGGLLLLGGRAADLLGRRRVFLVALAVFAAAAFTAPAGLSIITTTFAEGPARNRALSIYSAFGAAGFSLGLVLSGLLTEISWRWTLLLPAPIAAVILVAGMRLIPRTDQPGLTHAAATAGRPGQTSPGTRRPARRGFDLLGAATVTTGMLLLVYAVVSAPQAGWSSPRTLVSFAGAIALLGAFVAVERRSRDPLVRLGIFRSGALTRANIAAMVLFGSYVSFQFLVTQYLQIMAGWSALGTALAFLPAGVLVAVSTPRMGSVLDRFGPARMIAAGFACLATGYTLFLRVGPAPDYPAVILPSLLLIGAAFGLGFTALNILATAGVADHEQGLASGILQTSFQVGGAIVLAVITAVIDTRGADHAVSANTLAAYRPALAVITGIAVLGLGVALTGLRSPRPRLALAALDPDADQAELEPVRS